MEQTIYGDVYFLVNFSMDFLSLFLTAKILHLPLKTGRTAFAAAVGGVWAVVALLPGQYDWIGTLIGLLIPALLCFIAFRCGRFRRFLLTVALFWGISFLTGGLMSALYYAVNRLFAGRQIVVNGTVQTVYSEIPLWVFALLALACALISLIWGRIVGKHRRSAACELVIGVSGNEYAMTGLVDSGNLLTEPFGGLPVILITADRLRAILPIELHAVFFGGSGVGDLPAGTASASRIRLIPYRGVGGGGLLFGYLPESITVDGRAADACIAAECGGRDFSGFDAIVPACL